MAEAEALMSTAIEKISDYLDDTTNGFLDHFEGPVTKSEFTEKFKEHIIYSVFVLESRGDIEKLNDMVEEFVYNFEKYWIAEDDSQKNDEET